MNTPVPIPASTETPLSIEELRVRLRPHKCSEIINEVESTLRDEYYNLGKNQIDALKLLVDIQFRKLSKFMPDLKAMDHNVGETASKVNFIINLDHVKPPVDADPNKAKVTL